MKLSNDKVIHTLCFSWTLIVLGLLATEGRSQNLLNWPVAPPPMKFISGNERMQLAKENDTKNRIKVNIELAENRLSRAEALTSAQNHEDAVDELASYRWLLEDAFAFLRARGKTDNKARDLYKKLELSMRAHGIRLENMRRSTPLEYAIYIKDIYDYTRNARTEALNSFYGDTVLKTDKRSNASDDTSAAPHSPPQMP